MPCDIPALDVKVSEHEHDPPAYTEGVVLYATTADGTTRYSRKYPLVKSVSLTIPVGLYAKLAFPVEYPNESGEKNASTAYILSPPRSWIQHLHPEGSTYFVNSLINVITDSNIRKPDVYATLMEGISVVQGLATSAQATLSAATELYIRADEPKTCHYYLVNHDTQAEFWLNENEFDELGFCRVVSMAHLKFALEEHYWTHVEYFPHRPISKHLLQELVAALRHGQIDHETSRSSTFPFDANQCKRFIKLLVVNDDETQTLFYTSMAARIWSSICKHRFDNMYGEEFARLDRGTRRRVELKDYSPFYMKVASALVFGHNKAVAKKLDDIYVDDTAYTMHWRNFIGSMYDSWRDSRLMSICLLIICAILVSHPRGIISYYVGLAAIAFSTLSLVSSVTLLHKYQGKLDLVAADAVELLSNEIYSSLGFQPLGLLMSTPWAFATWSLVFLVTQIFSIIVESTGVPPLYNIIIVFGALALILVMITVRLLAATLLDIWRRRRRQYGSPV